MKLDFNLIPNIKNLDPKFLKATFDPTGEFHVIKDFGITMFFYQNTDREALDRAEDDEGLLRPPEREQSRRAARTCSTAPRRSSPSRRWRSASTPTPTTRASFDETQKFLLSIRKGVTTISSFGYINDASAGKIILSQGWNGDVRRILKARKKEGDITAVLPTEKSEVWADNWCIPATAPHPVAAHAWINWLLEPTTAVTEMNYHNYPIPIPAALDRDAGGLQERPAVQRAVDVHRQLPVHPEPEPAARERAHEDLSAVQGCLVSVAGPDPEWRPSRRP